MDKTQSTKVITGKVRFSYVNIFKARTFTDGADPKYSICILIDKKDKKTLSKINAAVDAAKEIGKSKCWNGTIPKGLKLPLRDGEEREDEAEEYKDVYFLNANSKNKPGIVDSDCNEILDSAEVYSGCYGRVSLNFFPYNNKGNKGIAAGLNNVQFLEDGEPLGAARTSAESDFGNDDDDGILG